MPICTECGNRFELCQQDKNAEPPVEICYECQDWELEEAYGEDFDDDDLEDDDDEY